MATKEEEQKAVEEKVEKVVEEKAEESSAPSASKDEHMIPKSRLDEEIAKRRVLEERLSLLEHASKEAEIKRLKETEDYKGLYEKVEKELAEIRPRAAIAESSEKTLRGVLENQIADLPENMRALIPAELTTQQQLQWLSKNKALLVKPKPVDIGAGRQGGGAPEGTPLTPEEIETAKAFGMKPEDYAKNKFK
jgi:phage I-like protein